MQLHSLFGDTTRLQQLASRLHYSALRFSGHTQASLPTGQAACVVLHRLQTQEQPLLALQRMRPHAARTAHVSLPDRSGPPNNLTGVLALMQQVLSLALG